MNEDAQQTQPLKRNVVLTGFMGTGKTTVGKLIAARLGYAFVDTDVMIEARSERTIADIFAQDGEAAFREMERVISAELASNPAQVIATGGGLLLNNDNVATLSASGSIFCLTAEPEAILARVTSDAKRIERPLLKVSDPAQRILDLLAARAAHYARFQQVATDGLTPPEVAAKVVELLV